jgi:hypothetical protein
MTLMTISLMSSSSSDPLANGGKRRTLSRCVAGISILLVLIALAAGCGGKRSRPQAPEPPPPKKDLVRTGFSIQAGAFSNVQNAIRLVESLERQGITAYYFRHSSGLFRVRFGDFPTLEGARSAAEALKRAGVLDVYQIVRPEEYAVAKARAHGLTGLRDEIVATAETFVGLKYQWGGQSPTEGFDCSGLAMAVYQLNGLNLPRTSGEQYLAGVPVPKSDLSKGDLVFFSKKGAAKVTHVGLYVGDNRFIHAPGIGKPIRFDSLTHSYYASTYMGGRTYL